MELFVPAVLEGGVGRVREGSVKFMSGKPLSLKKLLASLFERLWGSVYYFQYSFNRYKPFGNDLAHFLSIFFLVDLGGGGYSMNLLHTR